MGEGSEYVGMTLAPIAEVNSAKFVLLPNISVPHGCTTRVGGVSEGHLASLNMGFTVGDDPANVWENRSRFARHLGVENLPWLLSMSHGSAVVCVEEAAPLPSDRSVKPPTHYNADAAITNVAGVPLGLTVADCVPVFFHDSVKGVVGVAHAGWRGTVGGIVAETVKSMKMRYGSLPGDIKVGIGPSIGPTAFEVGPEVVEEFRQVFVRNSEVIREHPDQAARRAGKAYIDLWRANALMAKWAGVPAANIEVSGWCTVSHPELFFSHRRDHGKSGRLLAAIILP